MRHILGYLMLFSISIAQAQQDAYMGILKQPCFDESGQSFLIETKLPRSGRIWALDWSPDDKFIAVGNATGAVRVYLANSLKLFKLFYGFNSTVNSIHFSPNTMKLAASGGNGEVVIWDMETSEMHALEGHKAQVRNLRWSPSGKFLATTSHDGLIKIWNANYDIVKTIDIGRGGCVGIDWLNDNEIAASCWDNTIRVLDFKTDKHLIFANGVQSTKAVLSVDWHPSGTFLTTGDYGNSNDPDHNIRFWSPKGEMTNEMQSHKKEIRALKWNSNGSILATGGETVRLWNKAGKHLRTITTNNSPVWSLDWNSKGTKVATGHNDGKVRIWNTSGDLIGVLNGHPTAISAYSFSEDNTQLIIGFSNGEMRYFDLKTLRSVTYHYHTRSITDIAWSHSGRKVAFSSNDFRGSIWEVNAEGLVNPILLEGHKTSMCSIEWSPDDTKVAIAGYENNIHVWDTNGTKVRRITSELKYINHLEWEGDNPKAFYQGESEPYLRGLPVVRNGNTVILVPLHDNKFAVFGVSGRLLHGSPTDFIKVFKSKKGALQFTAF